MRAAVHVGNCIWLASVVLMLLNPGKAFAFHKQALTDLVQTAMTPVKETRLLVGLDTQQAWTSQ